MLCAVRLQPSRISTPNLTEQLTMNPNLAAEIQMEQEHGRAKYGAGPADLAHDDRNTDEGWFRGIRDHNERSRHATPLERRQHLVKVAGLAVSAIESFDRKHKK